MRNKCIVIGGGLAGLSAAVNLARAGIHVELFEASPKPGGRAYSLTDRTTGETIDNGQHIMMGCYKETLRFLGLIGAMDTIDIRKRLKVNFVDKSLGVVPLEAKNGIYPLNLLSGLLSYKALNLSERFEIVSLFSRLIFIKPKSLFGRTAFEWLKDQKQSPRTIKAFWDILAVGALNTDLRLASASIFAAILKRMFLKGSSAASIILPKTGLSEMYCRQSAEFICSHGGSITLSEPVKGVEIDNGSVQKIILENREVTGFDFVVSAVPFHSFAKIFPEEFVSSMGLSNLSYSSILSLNLWLKENPFTEDFYGLIDSPVHWVFNHRKYITIVISNADGIIEKSRPELLEMILSELEGYFPQFKRSMVYETKLIKEKRATFIPESNILGRRPQTKTPFENLMLAGDWTATGLPATIEGAVKSGYDAARAVTEALQSRR